MNIFYNNRIYFFKEDDYEKNILFLKIRDKFNLDNIKCHSIVDLVLSKKRYGCKYSDEIEKIICNYINETI